MISVVRVFNAIRDLCNEDQRGFVTPEVFNSFAEIAQEAVYEDMKAEVLATDRLRKSNADLGGVDSAKRGGKDAMSDYLIEDDLVSGIKDTNEFRLIFDKPKDLDRIISITTNIRGNKGKTSYCEVLYDVEKVGAILRSNLSAPTEEYPIAIITNDIEVIPDDTRGIKVTHYRRPTSVYVAGVNAGELDRQSFPRYVPLQASAATGLVVLDSVNSRNFDLPRDRFQDLVNEIAGMMGVRLRDPMIATYSAQQQAQA